MASRPLGGERDISSLFVRTSRYATNNFGLAAPTLYRNVPRFPFEYYINFNLNRVSPADEYIASYFNNADWDQIAPLVKSVDMPSFKIETTPLNQYNRKRLSQSRITFDPVKVVFHDVADGKTLKFWEMYYRYYFMDGNEPGMNAQKLVPATSSSGYNTESFVNSSTAYTPNVAGTRPSVTNTTDQNSPSDNNSSNNTDGQKSLLNNIVADTLNNHNFGFNLPTVGDNRNLIDTIEIYQVHADRFNQVTLVNPRISSFTHDNLSYAEGGKTLEITFTIDYEYAYYTIQNMLLANGQPNNNSEIDQYNNGGFLDFNRDQFGAKLTNIETPIQPTVYTKNFTGTHATKNNQLPMGVVTRTHSNAKVKHDGKGPAHRGSRPNNNIMTALSAMLHLKPTIYAEAQQVEIQARSFASKAMAKTPFYIDHRNKIRY